MVVVSHPPARKAVLLPADPDGQEFIGFDEDLSIRRELDRFFRDLGIEMIKEADRAAQSFLELLQDAPELAAAELALKR